MLQVASAGCGGRRCCVAQIAPVLFMAACAPLYHVVVDVAGDLDDLAGAITHADGSDPQVCAALREAWDGIMERVGRIEQLLAALPMPEREAENETQHYG